jgi:hypothetical protein
MAKPLIVKQHIRHIANLLMEGDKQQHFAICLVLVVTFWPLTGSPTTALVLTLLVGLAKEIWDGLWGSGFCWLDMTANILGALCGLVAVWGLLQMAGALSAA